MKKIMEYRRENIATGNKPMEINPEKQLQQRLVLILHAHKCSKTETALSPCFLNHCDTFKTLLRHMTICEILRGCKFSDCTMARMILKHWRTCIQRDCPLCEPIRNPKEELKSPQRLLLEVCLESYDNNEWRTHFKRSFREKINKKVMKSVFPEDSPDFEDESGYFKGFAREYEQETFEKAETFREYYYLMDGIVVKFNELKEEKE